MVMKKDVVFPVVLATAVMIMMHRSTSPVMKKVGSFTELQSSLNLTLIQQKVAIEENWTPAYTDRVVEEYYRFLYIVINGNRGSPSRDVDKMWHMHILDTRKYMSDCSKFFGVAYLHHRPSYTVNERIENAEAFDSFMKVYRNLFGSAPTDIWPSTDGTFVLGCHCAKCRQCGCMECNTND